MLSLSGRILDRNEPTANSPFGQVQRQFKRFLVCLLELRIEFRRQASFTTAFARNTSPLGDFDLSSSVASPRPLPCGKHVGAGGRSAAIQRRLCPRRRPLLLLQYGLGSTTRCGRHREISPFLSFSPSITAINRDFLSLVSLEIHPFPSHYRVLRFADAQHLHRLSKRHYLLQVRFEQEA